MIKNVKKVFWVASIILASLILIGCANNDGQIIDNSELEPASSTQPLTGKTWILQASNQPLLPESVITIEFTEDGKLNGSSGCNSYFGSYTIEGDILTVDGIGATEMWCEDMMEQEMAFLEMLQNAATIEFTESALTIHTDGGDLNFSFTPAKHTPLAGIKWTLNGIAQNGVVSSTPVDKDIYIQFDGEAAQGNSGCNSFSGNYQIDDDALTVSGIVGTMMACVDGERNQREAGFLTALGETTSFRIETDQLILTDAAGDDRLFFMVAEPAQ